MPYLRPETAAAVDDEPLPGDETGALRGEEADGVGDIPARAHAPGGHRREVRAADGVRDVRVALDGDEPWSDAVDRDAERCELARPGARQPDLRVLGRCIGRPARRRR